MQTLFWWQCSDLWTMLIGSACALLQTAHWILVVLCVLPYCGIFVEVLLKRIEISSPERLFVIYCFIPAARAYNRSYSRSAHVLYERIGVG